MELVEDEQDKDEAERAAQWETGMAAPVPSGPASGAEDGPDGAGTAQVPAAPEEGPADIKGPVWTAGPLESGEELPEGGQAVPEVIADAAEPALERLWRDAPAWDAAGADKAGTPERAEAKEAAPAAAERHRNGREADAGAEPMGPAERGLEELYQKTAAAARSALQPPGGGQAGRTIRVGEPEPPRQLTVDELDRAVRRDSRRYDGGLDIF